MLLKTISIITLFTFIQINSVHAGGGWSQPRDEADSSKNIPRLCDVKQRISDAASGQPLPEEFPSALEQPYRNFAKVAVHFQGDELTKEAGNLNTNRDYWRMWNNLMAAVTLCEGDLDDLVLAATGLPMTPSVPDDVLENELDDKVSNAFEAVHEAILGHNSDNTLALDMNCAYLPPSVALAKTSRLRVNPEIVAIGGQQPTWTHLPHVFPTNLSVLYITGPGTIRGYHKYEHADVIQIRPEDHRQLAIPLCMGALPLTHFTLQSVPVVIPEFLFQGLAPTLKELSLSSNPAKAALPQSLSGLVNLEVLKLDKNDVSVVPSIAGLTNLTCLVVYERCLREISGLNGIVSSWVHPLRVLKPEKVTQEIGSTVRVEDEASIYFPSLPREQLWDYGII